MGVTESFNSRMQEKGLSEHIFLTLTEATGSLTIRRYED